MKNILFLIFFLSISIQTFAQENQKAEKPVYEEVDDKASFPGGINAFRTAFAQSFNSKLVFGKKGNYKTQVTFVVERNGTLSDVKAIGPNMSLNVQAVQAVKNIEEKWTPAYIKETAVRSMFRFPVSLNLE